MALNEAHLVQTKLIEGDAGEGKMKVSLVLSTLRIIYDVHALRVN